jgi:hypothetical protein
VTSGAVGKAGEQRAVACHGQRCTPPIDSSWWYDVNCARQVSLGQGKNKQAAGALFADDKTGGKNAVDGGRDDREEAI